MTLSVVINEAIDLQPPSFEAILEAIADPVLLIDEVGGVAWANAAAESVLGETVSMQPVRSIFPSLSVDLDLIDEPTRMLIATRGGQVHEALLNRLGTRHLVLTLRVGSASRGGVTSETDELTGVAKRKTLVAAVEEALLEADGSRFAVHCLDLDRFKTINDTLGHGVGDALLQKVAARLKSACRARDVVARIGGDEFVVLQRDVASVEDAEKLALRIVDLVGRTYVLQGHTVNIGASVGVALGSTGKQARDILRDADLALYEAKRAGKGRHRLFEDEMSVSLRERRELEIDLRKALALRQFELNYQPFVELDSNNVRGFEALLRWHHPVRGTVPPLDFIPMAEETGLIVKLGEWVLRTACQQAASWPEPLIVAVNVSPLQFKADNLLDLVGSALAHAGLPSDRLELEITESALLDDTNNVLATLHAIRALGVKISMDDFGTGYSSLSYLQKFPFDKIKIDRSFVAGDNSDSKAILKAVASLGASLGMAITAEGVETLDQLEHIRDQRCTHVQGYLTGRPMTGGSIAEYLSTHQNGSNDA